MGPYSAPGYRHGLGPTRGRKLAEHFGRPANVFHVPLTELEAVGLQPVSAQSIASGESLQKAEAELASAQNTEAKIITPADSEYPARLLEIYDPPLCLYVRGNASILSQPGVAAAGNPTSDPIRRGHGRTASLRPFGPWSHH